MYYWRWLFPLSNCLSRKMQPPGILELTKLLVQKLGWLLARIAGEASLFFDLVTRDAILFHQFLKIENAPKKSSLRCSKFARNLFIVLPMLFKGLFEIDFNKIELFASLISAFFPKDRIARRRKAKKTIFSQNFVILYPPLTYLLLIILNKLVNKC